MPATKQIADKRGEKAATKKFGGKRKKIDSDEEAYTAGKAGNKKEKDPDAPKKPQTAYFLFMNANRKPLKESDPTLTFGELTMKLTEMWKNLDETAKKEFEGMAQKDKQRYQDEMEAKGLAKKKPPVDQNAPKKPVSSFFHFSNDARERIKKDTPAIKQTDILKQVGVEWKQLSDTQKKKWKDISKADKARYEKEMANHKPGTPTTIAATKAAGSKRPANKGPGSSSKKAKKET